MWSLVKYVNSLSENLYHALSTCDDVCVSMYVRERGKENISASETEQWD